MEAKCKKISYDDTLLERYRDQSYMSWMDAVCAYPKFIIKGDSDCLTNIKPDNPTTISRRRKQIKLNLT